MTRPDRSIARGMAWVGTASSLVAAFDLIALAVILQRWVTKEEFGTVSVAVTMFGALQLLGEAGLPAALVQRREIDDTRVSTMYWLGLLTGAALYGVIWLASPWVASAYELPVLAPVLRVLGLLVVIRPLYTVQQALVRRELRFRAMSIVRIIANACELAVKLGVAIGGGGLWAFVLAPIVRELVYAIGLPLCVRFRPRWTCRPRLVGEDYRFGLRATGGELLFQVYSNLDYQIVGYAYGPAALGVYRAAFELVLEPVRFVSGVVTVVAFPAFARLRGDRPGLVAQFVAFSRQNLTVVLVLVGLVLITAEDLLQLTYGAAYVPAADAARVLAIVGVLRALSHLGPPLLDGVGRPDLSLRYHVAAALVLALAFTIAATLGETYLAIAVGWACGYPIAFALLGAMVLRELDLRPGAYLARLRGIAVLVAIATACGGLVHLATGGLAPVVRFVISSVVTIGLAGVLLARVEGMSLRGPLRRRDAPPVADELHEQHDEERERAAGEHRQDQVEPTRDRERQH